MQMLELKHVVKRYDSKIAVNRVSLSMNKGEIFGILGPNGAGKTSTIRMICGITVPDEGQVLFSGTPMNAELQNRIGYLPEERGLYKKMKVGELLLYLAELKGLSESDAKERITSWLTRFEIESWRDKKVEELSKGMQQKVQFITVVLHDPDLLILDEPFSGLDPINAELIMDVILELKERGKTIIFSTHRMEQVEKICDAIALINNGSVILQGRVREIKSSFGKNHVLVEFEGSDEFINRIVASALAEVASRSPKQVEFRLSHLDHAMPMLRMILNEINTELVKFERTEPTLKEIFIQTVEESNRVAV